MRLSSLHPHAYRNRCPEQLVQCFLAIASPIRERIEFLERRFDPRNGPCSSSYLPSVFIVFANSPSSTRVVVCDNTCQACQACAKKVWDSGKEGAWSSAFGYQTAEVSYRYCQVKAEDVIVVLFPHRFELTIPSRVRH